VAPDSKVRNLRRPTAECRFLALARRPVLHPGREVATSNATEILVRLRRPTDRLSACSPAQTISDSHQSDVTAPSSDGNRTRRRR